MKSSLRFLHLIGVVAVIQAVAMPATATAIGWGNELDDPRAKVLYGGWNPIDNIDDPEIQGLGEWAVSEHVKRENNGLKFVKVVSGEKQTVAGMNYWLFIQALNGNGEKVTYKAQVYEDWWPTTHELVSFGPAN